MSENRPPVGPVNRSRLLGLIKLAFEVEDLRLLCFELDIAFGNLGSATRDGKAADLIDLARANNMLPALVVACRGLRPGLDWASVIDAPPPPTASSGDSTAPQLPHNGSPTALRESNDARSRGPALRVPPSDAGAMVRIPADPDRRARYGVDVAEFLIDPYPVTVRQYAVFLETTGARAPKLWTEQGRPAPRLHDHPVVGVSWEDALAYANWLGKRLPSAAEWEVAACGAARRKYPWGDAWVEGACNSAEAGLGATSPVNRYPGGASPYGVFDMVGNVWEWTSNEARSRVIGRAGTQRVLKGGSFRETRETAHCRAQIQRWPEDVADDVGFRCAW